MVRLVIWGAIELTMTSLQFTKSPVKYQYGNLNNQSRGFKIAWDIGINILSFIEYNLH